MSGLPALVLYAIACGPNISGCTGGPRPAIHSNMSAADMENGARSLFSLRMTKSEFTRIMERLPAEPATPTWVATPDHPEPVPAPFQFVDSDYMWQRGVVAAEPPLANSAPAGCSEEHFALRDWYERRDGYHLFGVTALVNADWNAALVSGYFDPSDHLEYLRIGPTIGMSGHIYRPTFILEE